VVGTKEGAFESSSDDSSCPDTMEWVPHKLVD
jgi:hypothetical protein